MKPFRTLLLGAAAAAALVLPVRAQSTVQIDGAGATFPYPIYAKCVELGLCLFVYVGMPGPLWPMIPNDPTVLDEVALAFPDLRIIAHHIGDPWNDVVVRLAARHRNYYICTSAWHPRSYPEQLVSFMRGKWHGTHGSEKVVFASDWPLLDMQKTVKAARELSLSQEQLSGY